MTPSLDADVLLAAAEARLLMDEFGGETPEDAETLADGLMMSLDAYDGGAKFGMRVIEQLRLMADEMRAVGARD